MKKIKGKIKSLGVSVQEGSHTYLIELESGTMDISEGEIIEVSK